MSGNNIPLTRALRAPVTLITVGVLFMLHNFTMYSIEKTWPVLLIVFGAMSLLMRAEDGSAGGAR